MCDWVIIGMKATANTAFEGLLRPLVGPHTAILTLQNGLGNEEGLARIFPADQILGGLCFVCLNRTAPGRIHHLAHGRIMMGEFGRKADARTHHLAATLINAGVPCGVTDDLAKAHWEKLVWNIPFNGLGVASAAGYESVEAGRRLGTGPLQRCQGTDVMLSDPRYESRVRGLMREVIAVANALGLGVDPSWEQNQIDHTLCMGPYVASTLVDFERGLPLELDALFLEPLRMARAAGVPVPLLEKLCSLLAELDKARACHLPPTR